VLVVVVLGLLMTEEIDDDDEDDCGEDAGITFSCSWSSSSSVC
jgi:hypothetical protein